MHPSPKQGGNWSYPMVRSRLQRAQLFLILLGLVIAVHFPLLRLPYFWDEAGYFVPAARDLLLFRDWIPRSIAPNIHPPAVMAYLAAAWRLAGYNLVTTRVAMLVLAAFGLFFTCLLAAELIGKERHLSWIAAILLFASPLFVAQSMLAQLDAPAMVGTLMALWFFLQGRIAISAVCCTVLVLTKETGLIVPAVFCGYLIRERRWRDALWFSLPALVLVFWIAALVRQTGSWAGTSDFASYNVRYPLEPFRLLLSLLRRLYFFFIADGRWIGTAAVIYAQLRSGLFRPMRWQIIWSLIGTQILLTVVLGGATLERYLLPVLPLLYLAMASSLALLPRVLRAIAIGALAGCLAIGNWINPPYPFPYEDNLAFADFAKLHEAAAQFLAARYPKATITTAWPLSLELSRPELGYVSRPLAVARIPDLTATTLRRTNWVGTDVFVMFSRSWDQSPNLMHLQVIRSLWERHYGELAATQQERLTAIPFSLVAHFERRGQWVDIFENPAEPATSEIRRASLVPRHHSGYPRQ